MSKKLKLNHQLSHDFDISLTVVRNTITSIYLFDWYQL